MPIRHCQKCGLKVLIDESQAAASPFYCQRCTTSLKNGGGAAEVPATARHPAPGGKPGTVKVQCPYCKASFNGRIPQKPARGACPVCQKELILLPSGEIRSSTGFDPIKWQREQAPKEEAPAVEAPPPEMPEEPAPAPAASSDVQMPSWMDEQGGAPAPAEAPPETPPEAPPEVPPEAPPEVPPEAPMPEAAAEAVIKNIESMPDEAPPAAEAPPPPEEPAPELPPMEVPPPEPPAEEPPPPPPPPPRPLPPTARKPGAPVPVTGRGTSRRGAVDITAPPATGTGLVVVAFFLMIVPVIACPILYNGRSGLKVPIQKIGENFRAGFYGLYQKLTASDEDAPKPDPVKKDAKKESGAAVEKPQPGPEDRKKDEDEITRLWTEYMREKRTVDSKAQGATDAEKEMIQKAQDELKKKLDAINELKARYKKAYGKDFEPQNQ